MNVSAPKPETARAVFDRAAALAPALAAAGAAERIAGIRRLIRTLRHHREEIHETGRLERGVSPAEMDGELVTLKFEADHIARHLAGWMRPKTAPPSLMTLGKKTYTRHEPKGAVLVLPSWNAPYAIGLLPALGALAAGNAVVVKPSELAPHSSALIARIVREAFPEGELSAIEGGAETAQALLDCPFNHIFYIGNNRVGRIVMRAAAEHFASVTLEMGGKNPTIVTASADIEDAAMKTCWGRIANAGQVCIAPDYALVEDAVADRFCEALKRQVASMYDPRGEGCDRNPEYPRIIDARHFERVRGLIEDARGKGAEILHGGECRAADRYVAPTLIANVTDDMRIMQEEVFGPVLAIRRWTRREEVIREIRGRDKPLALYVFSRNREEIDFFLRNTSAGGSVVNHNVVQSGTNPHVGFGGVNSSGIGRMLGWNTFNEASNPRTIMEEGPSLMDPRAMFPPLSDRMKKLLAGMLDSRPVPEAAVRAMHAAIRLIGWFSGSSGR